MNIKYKQFFQFVLLSCFMGFLYSSKASDLSPNDEQTRYLYTSTNKRGVKIRKTEEVLDSMDASRLTNEEDYRQNIEGNFFNYLRYYKKLDFSNAPDKKVEMATKLRTYETKLAPYYNGELFKPEDLWDGEETLEFIEIKNMADLEKAKRRGAQTPPIEIRKLIENGGSTGFPFNFHVPPQFFRLPSNFKGQRFLVGGERENLSTQQEDYMLNFDKRFHPDILANASHLSSYVCIPDNKFSIVEFNLIDNRILLSIPILLECKRILQNGGTLIFKTQRDSNNAYQAMNAEIKEGIDNLKVLFSNVNMKFETDNNWESQEHNKYCLFTAKKA